MKLAVYLLFLLMTVSCKKPEESKPKVITVNSVAADFKVPEQIFIEMKKRIQELTIGKEFIFTDLEVELYSDQQSVLSYPHLRFKLSNSGGEIDLKDYVTGQGSFYLRFPPEQFLEKPALEFLFYISESPKNTIRGEEFGLGCGQWVDLMPKFTQLQDKTFLKVNTVDQTYIHVLAGHYIFVFKSGPQYYLTHLHLFDSRYNGKTCSSIFGAK